jgi:hypothetical protein
MSTPAVPRYVPSTVIGAPNDIMTTSFPATG